MVKSPYTMKSLIGEAHLQVFLMFFGTLRQQGFAPIPKWSTTSPCPTSWPTRTRWTAPTCPFCPSLEASPASPTGWRSPGCQRYLTKPGFAASSPYRWDGLRWAVLCGEYVRESWNNMLDIFDLEKIWFGKETLPMFGKCILDIIKPNVFQSKMVSYIWFGKEYPNIFPPIFLVYVLTPYNPFWW